MLPIDWDIVLPNAAWREKLLPTLQRCEDVDKFLGPGRDETFPTRENTFRALSLLPPSEWKIVIFGQDPYPRKESAIGIAFCDGQIKDV